MNIFDMFETLLRDSRWLYLGLLIVLAISMTMYIPMTSRITKMTTDYYNVIEAAPPGAVMISEPNLNANWGQGVELTRGPTWKYWLAKGNIIVWPTTAAGQSYEILWYKQVLGVPDDYDLSKHPLYGIQFVILPASYPGNYYTWASNFRAGGEFDYYGNDFDDLPCIKNLKSGSDIYAYIGNPLGGDFTVAFTQKGTNCIAGSDGGGLSVASTYYGVGLLKGVLLGVKGANEYLVMIGADTSTYPNNWAVTHRTPMLLTSVYILVASLLINLVNVISLMVRKKHLSIRIA